MVTYFTLLITTTVLGAAFFWKGTTPKRNKYFLILSFLIIFLLQSIRKFTVGVDVPTYVEAFYSIQKLPWDNCRLYDWEPLFAYMNKLIGEYTNHYSWLLAAVSAIILGGCGFFIYKNASNTFWPVFLFITLDHMFVSMYSLRQYCALAIGINIYTVLKSNTSLKGYIKAFILLLIAMMFHTTAIVCSAFIIVFMLGRINKNKILFCLFIGLSATLFFDKMIQIFLQLFSRYAYYQTTNSLNFQGGDMRSIDLVYDGIKVICLFVMWKFRCTDKDNQNIFKLLLLSLVASILSLFVLQVKLVWRLTFYFDILLIILIPMIIDKVKYYRHIAYAGLYLFGVTYFSYIMLLNGGKCVPYMTFWR